MNTQANTLQPLKSDYIMKTNIPNITLDFYRITELKNIHGEKTHVAEFAHFKNTETGQELRLTRYDSNPVIANFDWTKWHTENGEPLDRAIYRLGANPAVFKRELL